MAAVNNPERLATGLFDRGFVRFGDFTLKSGQWSPVYINLRGIGSIDKSSELTSSQQHEVRDNIVGAYLEQVNAFPGHDHIIGIPEAATTLAGMIGYAAYKSVLQLRVKEKEHGQPKNIEGDYTKGQSVVLVDDLITTGGAKLEAREKVEFHGLAVSGIAVLVDREQGGVQELASAGLRTEAAIGMGTLIDVLAAERRIDTAQTELLKGYFAGEITQKPQ